MADKINFALIGCGRIGTRHAEQISKQGKLLAVCDTDITKANFVADKYSVKAYTDIMELLAKVKNIDVVSVCTPNGLHAQHSIQALKAGHHVLCEKPMAISVNDCGEMIMAAEKANKELFIVNQNRYNPPVIAIKKAIDENRFGKLYSVQLSCFWNRDENYYKDSWRGTKALDGGTLFTQFSHFIDLLYWMFGDVKKTSSILANQGHKNIIEFEDTGVIALEFNSGVLGTVNFTVNSFKKNMEGSLTIFGEKGTAKIGGQYLNELEYQLFEDYEITDLPAGNPANNYGEYFGSMSNHDKVYKNVIDVLNHNAVNTSNGNQGMRTVELIEKIYNAD